MNINHHIKIILIIKCLLKSYEVNNVFIVKLYQTKEYIVSMLIGHKNSKAPEPPTPT